MSATEPKESRRSVFTNGNFVTLLSGQFLSQVGNTLFALGSAWYVLSWTHSRAALGLVGALAALGAAFGFISGTFVDRWDRRRTMFVSDVIRAIIVALVTWAAATGVLPFWAFLVAVLLLSVTGTFFSPAMGALLPEIVGSELAPANAAIQGGNTIAQLGGSAFTGVLLATVGPILMFASDAFSFAISFVSVGLMRLQRESTRGRIAGGRGIRQFLLDARQGLREVMENPFLRRLVPVAVIVNFGSAPMNILDVAWVRQELHLGAYAYAGLGIAVLMGAVVGSVVSPLVIRRLTLGSAITFGLVMIGAFATVFAAWPNIYANLACLFMIGISTGVINTSLITGVQRATPSALLGRVFGALTATMTLANPLGFLIAGLVASVVPLPAVFLSCGILIAAGALLMIGAPQNITPSEVAS